MGELRINISKLSEGTHQYSFETEASRLSLGEEFRGSIRVEARLEKTTRQLFLSVELTAQGRFVCDRCLEDFDKKLSGSYSVVYVMDERDAGTAEDEVQLLAPDTNMIELDEDVRQYLQLLVPLKLLCKEDCQGICPTCGKNKNLLACTCKHEEADSRWDVLKKIAKN